MKKSLCLLTIVAVAMQLNAQPGTIKDIQTSAATSTTFAKDTTRKADKNGWIKGGNFSLSLTQVGNSNWISAGADQFSISIAGSLNAFASKAWGKNSWDNYLDVAYGMTNSSTQDFRKLNDRFEFTSRYGYTPEKWKNVNIGLLGNFRTQMTDGYQYNYLGTTEKRRNSGFFAPAYVVLSPGIDWKPKSWLSLFISPASARATIVSNGPYSFVGPPPGIFNFQKEVPLATLYGVDSVKGYRIQFGAFASIIAKTNLGKNVTYFGKMDLYTDYLHDFPSLNVYWVNKFNVKLYKWLSLTYELDMQYDPTMKDPNNPTNTLGLQVLSTFGLGIAARF